jgi:hypothetical protein
MQLSGQVSKKQATDLVLSKLSLKDNSFFEIYASLNRISGNDLKRTVTGLQLSNPYPDSWFFSSTIILSQRGRTSAGMYS